MIERIERVTSLGGQYAATVAALARTELRQDTERLKTSLLATAAGGALAVLGAVWLNVALLLLLLRTDYPIVGAALIGVVALIVGLVFVVRARRSVEELRMLEATRRVLAEEFGGGDGSAPLQAHSPAIQVHVPAPMMPAEASARLREIREEIRETMSLNSGQRIEMVDATGRPFEPRSRTMRTMLWLWTALPRVPSGTAFAGTLGVIAVSSPTLRRLLALLALARTLVGGASRPTT